MLCEVIYISRLPSTLLGLLQLSAVDPRSYYPRTGCLGHLPYLRLAVIRVHRRWAVRADFRQLLAHSSSHKLLHLYVSHPVRMKLHCLRFLKSKRARFLRQPYPRFYVLEEASLALSTSSPTHLSAVSAVSIAKMARHHSPCARIATPILLPKPQTMNPFNHLPSYVQVAGGRLDILLLLLLNRHPMSPKARYPTFHLLPLESQPR